jgi:hypothetical protein
MNARVLRRRFVRRTGTTQEDTMARSRAAIAAGALLLLIGAGSAEGQSTATMDKPKPGAMRMLVCRGGPGLHLTTEADPSPRGDAYAAVVLRYQRNTRPAGEDYRQLDPGACSWNPSGDASIPAEPGIVHFDVARHGSAEVADPKTLAEWLREAEHLWTFFVDDATNLSISHGPFRARFWVASERHDKSTKSNAGLARRVKLRCRGGTGLVFTRGKIAGTNLVGMTLTYRPAGSAAGPTGAGLSPGTCAWANRSGIPGEPGRVAFVTAGNAQLKQIQSGSAVDRTTTAAERWPDAQTIPVYMAYATHYWKFTIQLSNADSALHHAAWKPPAAGDLAVTPPSTNGAVPTATTMAETDEPEDTSSSADTPSSPAAPYSAGAGTTSSIPSISSPSSSTSGVVGAKPPAGTSTRVSLPGGSTTGERYTSGSSTTVTDPRLVYDIRNVQVRAGLEGVSIRFEAAPNLAPTVLVNSAAPMGSEGAFRFQGQPLRLIVQGTPTGGALWHYTAASNTPLARGTQYWFIAEAPEGPNSRFNQATGEFRTLAQRFKLTISEIYVVSDGDTDSPGDLWFAVKSCPEVIDQDLVGSYGNRVQWSEGRQRVAQELVGSGTSVPDRFRLLIVGVDDDRDLGSSFGASNPFWVYYSCDRGGDLEPYKTSKAEWNSIALDIDLTRYPGTSGGEPFVRRSKALRNGSTLMFEVRGYIGVTRE